MAASTSLGERSTALGGSDCQFWNVTHSRYAALVVDEVDVGILAHDIESVSTKGNVPLQGGGVNLGSGARNAPRQAR